jgi:hypothetical protein
VLEIEARIEKTFAETRKLNAEARSQEIQNTIRELELTLRCSKALLIGEQDHEAAIFGQQVDAFLEAVKVVNEDRKALEAR